MAQYGFELEVSNDGDTWTKLGFEMPGGFVPYRYEMRVDALASLDKLAPSGFRRVVPSKSVMENYNG